MQSPHSFPPGGTSRLFDADARGVVLTQITGTLDELRQAYLEISAIRRRMVGIRSKLLQLKTQLNAFTYISIMPPEILGEIFLQCIGKDDNQRKETPTACRTCIIPSYPSTSSSELRSTLSRVCTNWASFVSSQPNLWTIIPWNAPHYRKVPELLSRCARAPLCVHINVGTYRNERFGERRKIAIREMRRILKRLHRVQDLAICDWAGFLEAPLTKYETYHAPILRRLAVSACNTFAGYRTASAEQFPFVLSSPCPSLRILVLHNVGISSVRPSMLPALLEFHFDDGNRSTPLDNLLMVLDSLPQLKALSVYQEFPSEIELLPSLIGSQKTVALPNLKSLNLSNMSIYLSRYLELPAITEVMLRARDRIEDAARVIEGGLLPDMVALYVSQSRDAGESNAAAAYKVTLEPSTSYDVHFEVTRQSTTQAESYSIHCHFNATTAHTEQSTVFGLCSAIRSWHVQELHVADRTSSRLVGMTRAETWTSISQSLPLIKVLRVEGEGAGKALFDVLCINEPGPPNLTRTFPAMKELILTQASVLSHLYFYSQLQKPVRTGYMALLAAALSTRKDHSLALEMLEIDCEEEYTKDDLAFLAPLVAQLTLHHIKPSPPPAGQQSPQADNGNSGGNSKPRADVIIFRKQGRTALVNEDSDGNFKHKDTRSSERIGGGEHLRGSEPDSDGESDEGPTSSSDGDEAIELATLSEDLYSVEEDEGEEVIDWDGGEEEIDWYDGEDSE